MPRDGVEYRDLGPMHFDRRDRTRTVHRLVKRLNDLGYDIEVRSNAA